MRFDKIQSRLVLHFVARNPGYAASFNTFETRREAGFFLRGCSRQDAALTSQALHLVEVDTWKLHQASSSTLERAWP
jgi:hypothetical protein